MYNNVKQIQNIFVFEWYMYRTVTKRQRSAGFNIREIILASAKSISVSMYLGLFFFHFRKKFISYCISKDTNIVDSIYIQCIDNSSRENRYIQRICFYNPYILTLPLIHKKTNVNFVTIFGKCKDVWPFCILRSVKWCLRVQSQTVFTLSYNYCN